VIVRGEEALLPRGSTRIEADDRLHVIVREEVSGDMAGLLERWRLGPVGVPQHRQTPLRAGQSVFTTRTWTEADGDAGFPKEVNGVPVAEQVRTRRDTRGALVMLEDGRFAVTGPLLAIGGPLQLQRYARRRLTSEEDAAARAWWQEVIGALAR
jgi:potassium/hydrogen antiporter